MTEKGLLGEALFQALKSRVYVCSIDGPGETDFVRGEISQNFPLKGITIHVHQTGGGYNPPLESTFVKGENRCFFMPYHAESQKSCKNPIFGDN